MKDSPLCAIATGVPAAKTARPSPAWALAALVLFVDALWLLATGLTVYWPARNLIALATVLSPLTISRYRSDVRIRSTVSACALLMIFAMAGSTLSYLVVGTNAPLVDATLAEWDGAIGFDWLALLTWLHSHAAIASALRWAYVSGLPQIVLVVTFLGFSARTGRLDEFVFLFLVATVIAVVSSGVFPAAGAWKHYAARDLPSLSHFEMLRAGTLRVLPIGQGLISMPSLHSAVAVLLVYAVRGTVLFRAFCVLNAALIASTPIAGGHYLVDVLAGIALALGLIASSRRWAAGTQRIKRPPPLSTLLP